MGMILGEKARSCSGRLGRVLVPVEFIVNSLDRDVQSWVKITQG